MNYQSMGIPIDPANSRSRTVMNYQQWAAKHPAAAADMAQMIGATDWLADSKTEGKSESWSQQTTRLSVAKQGAYSWRNNNGATQTKCSCGATLCCPACGKKPRFYRWGLCNDSAGLNEKFKSSDLILGIPRRITPAMVNTIILQFGSVECKKPGWCHNPKDKQEIGQVNWLTLIQRAGGFATFSTGDIRL